MLGVCGRNSARLRIGVASTKEAKEAENLGLPYVVIS